MTWRTIAVIVIIAAPFAIGAIDLVLYVHGGNSATISRVCLDTSRSHPLFMLAVVFLFGLLCGHLFVPQHVAAK